MYIFVPLRTLIENYKDENYNVTREQRQVGELPVTYNGEYEIILFGNNKYVVGRSILFL